MGRAYIMHGREEKRREEKRREEKRRYKNNIFIHRCKTQKLYLFLNAIMQV
jgi:hypothetical protein